MFLSELICFIIFPEALMSWILYEFLLLIAIFKKSATGLLTVIQTTEGLKLVDKVDWRAESEGELVPIYEEGAFYNRTTLTAIREKLQYQIK